MHSFKRKGFTLAELLAVITILGVIALIVFPAVNKAIKNSKEKAYNQQVESILSSAENWTLENMSSLSDTNDNYITIGELQQSGFLEAKKVINPKTDEEMNGCIIIKYDESYNQYTYQYKDETCTYVAEVPIITLNGDATMEIGLGEIFTDPGYSATYRGNDVTSSVVVSGVVNTDEIGTYTIEYSVTKDGKSAKKYRTVIVKLMYRTFRQVMEPLLGTEVGNADPDQNLRYVGADPDNYVMFNGDLWRVIGLFGEQPKLIQDDFYHTDIEWDDDSNDWTNATLKNVLNTTFLNSIDSVSKSYIDQNYTWNIGATPRAEYYGPYNINRVQFYELERGNTPSAGVTDSSVTWQGAIGLIYPSDYGYSTSGDKSVCDSVSIDYWYRNESDWAEDYYYYTYEEYLKYSAAERCRNKAWLYDSSYGQWVITSSDEYLLIMYGLSVDGTINMNYDTGSYVEYYHTSGAKPTLYLKSNVVIIDGTGDSQDPYILDIIS